LRAGKTEVLFDAPDNTGADTIIITLAVSSKMPKKKVLIPS